MAVSALLAGVAPDKLIYLLAQDGAAGTALNLTAGSGGPVPPDPAADALDWTDLAAVLARTGLTAAQAQGIAQGVGVGVNATVDPARFCTSYIQEVTGAPGWLLASTAAAGRVQWNITAPATAATALLVIEYAVPVGPA